VCLRRKGRSFSSQAGGWDVGRAQRGARVNLSLLQICCFPRNYQRLNIILGCLDAAFFPFISIPHFLPKALDMARNVWENYDDRKTLEFLECYHEE
jgi:hypothetical protein